MAFNTTTSKVMFFDFYSRIHASDDFKKFVTIDNAGIVYILEEINNINKSPAHFKKSPTNLTKFTLDNVF